MSRQPRRRHVIVIAAVIAGINFSLYGLIANLAAQRGSRFEPETCILGVRQLARYPGAITTNPYPNEADLNDLKAVHEALAQYGVVSADGGYDVSTLAAAIYAHGWSYDIDRAGGDFRASVNQSSGDLGQFHAVGMGWSLEVALAFALEKAFAIAQRRESLATR
jgi:hypothetical protein